MGSNLIAPGLSCSFGITLTAFEASATHCDTLKVIYESGEEPLSVQLIAKRETPQILFPQHAEVGACLVGSTKTLSLRFQISTSSARICVRSETDGAFKISPDRFDLSSGDYADLQVSFSPRACGEVTEAFKVYAGDVNLGEIGCHDPAFDWSIANSRLRAKSQVPISLSFCANSLTNPSAVCPIAFCWELSRMKKAFLNSVVSNEQAEIVRGSVDLESGLLQPLETQIIKLSLTPLRVGSIECLLPCRLNDQPDGLTWLQVLFVVVSPNIELETDSIDFGKLRPGQCATRTTYLANPASLSLSWAVKHPQMVGYFFLFYRVYFYH
ncbi:unnamed protein product [Mesocestoides corti]|uniref:Abnormal spindle-like microcephaly-associated protein ASH domain-containing protein n=1 Tax=Mesocestoides corti TaxID=53468 RepID=A0A0R3U448_MESCO|nr:unnamed protein product [Mesocestoides corti]